MHFKFLPTVKTLTSIGDTLKSRWFEYIVGHRIKLNSIALRFSFFSEMGKLIVDVFCLRI